MPRSSENLEKHRDGRVDEGHIAKCKVPLRVDSRSDLKVLICSSDLRYPGSAGIDE